MDRKRFGNVAEFVGVAALVLSLIFVGMEIRQAADINSAQAVQSLNLSTSELMRQIAINDELSGLLNRASNDYVSLDADEQIRVGFWYRAVINSHEAAWKFHSKGLIDDLDHQAWIRSFCNILVHREGARREWLSSWNIYNQDFVEEYNAHCGIDNE